MSDLSPTLRSLHGVAELLLAGPQHARSGTIRLRPTDGGFGTTTGPDVRVVGGELRTASAAVVMDGRPVREVGVEAGLTPVPLTDVYEDGSGVGVDDVLVVAAEEAAAIAEAFRVGDVALRRLAPGDEPVLWPEHFDLGITLGEVNYGVSPGDAFLGEPYAYVGPWSAAPRTGSFWNAPFGAAVPLTRLGSPAAVADFFAEGRRAAGA